MNKLFSSIDVSNRETLINQPRQWFAAHGTNILFIVAGAWVTERLLTTIINGLLGRAMQNHAFNSDTDRKKRAETLHKLIEAVIRLAVWLIAAVMIVDELGINTAPLLASAGVVGVALGIGAQSFIKDFVSGIFIISENQYRVGDVVQLNIGTTPISGTVEGITVRTTIVRDVNGTRQHVPNGNITVASNKTFGFSKLNEMLVVDKETDLAKLEKVIKDVGDSLAADEEIGKLIKKTPTMEQVGGYNEQGLSVYIRGTTTAGGQWKVKTALYKRLQEQLKKAGIGVATQSSNTTTKK